MGGGHVTDGRLVVPEGLVIDQVARARLDQQLDLQPPEVVGVAAEVGELPAGSSYRVEAEWRSLAPISALVEPTGPVRGAVLLRRNTRFEVSDGLVGVDGPIVVDHGTHVHDPQTPLGSLRVASQQGRPPFPRRPVAVFAATEPDAEIADWARRMVNRLVRREVEARLAFPAIADGMDLTRPCLVGAESIAALAPDVIVALDAGAAAQAGAWCGSDRATVVIELIDDLTFTQRLVSWQIDRARGRVRAQVSRRVGTPALATLVRRLCAGPQPIAPTDEAADAAAHQPAVRENWGARAAARTTCVVVTGELNPAATTRWAGLTDHFEAAGVGVVKVRIEAGVPRGAHSASLVVLAGVEGLPAITELVEERNAQQLPTVVDVDATDIVAAGDGADGSLTISPAVAQLATLCANVLTPTDALGTALRKKHVRSFVVPSMLTREQAAAFRNTEYLAKPKDRTNVGWYVGSEGESAPEFLDAVAGGLAKALADRVDMYVDIVGDSSRVPAGLRRHDRVSLWESAPDPDVISGWALHAWTPRIVAGEFVDDLAWLVRASAAGVTSILPKPAARAFDGTAAHALLVSRYEEPEGWASGIRRLLDDDAVRARCAVEARRWARSVHGSPACRASVNRLLGWAQYEGRR